MRENLSSDEFIRYFEQRNKVVLLRDVMESLPALTEWDYMYLLKHSGDIDFAAGSIHLKFSYFCK